MMGLKVVEAKFGERAPADLSKTLRQLADDVDSGKVTSLVAAYVSDGCYEMAWATSLTNALVLASLLQDSAINRYKQQG